MKRLLEATQKAKQDTARVLTSQLRQHALNSGWHPEVVDHIAVTNKGGKFTADIHPDYAARAFTHEYGNETTRPTATIRKFLNNPRNINTAAMAVINHHLKASK